MTFPWTLQRYIFREMGKTSLLAAAGLTVSLSLGGGVLNMIKLGEVTPGQLMGLMTLVIPVAAALTLPVALLFGAAATYGRLSADNEFVACRSSGINLHVLFLPALVLSVLAGALTFACINFLIPRLVRNLNDFLQADVGKLIQQQLTRPKGIALGSGGRGYRISADSAAIDPDDPDHILLEGIAFVEIEGRDWVRYGTARQVSLRFDRTGGRLRVSGRMTDLSFYDRQSQRFGELAEQIVPPNELPALVPLKIKFLNLPQLLHFWIKPHEWHEVRDALQRVQMQWARRILYDELSDEWVENDKSIVLSDETTTCTVRSTEAYRIPRDGGIELAHVTIEERTPQRLRTCTAERAVIETTPGNRLEDAGVRLTVYDARITLRGRTVTRAKETFGPIALPQPIMDRVTQWTPDELFDPVTGETDPLAEERAEARNERAQTVRRVVAAIHERSAFSVSVLTLVILGAALGIVFRGSQAVVAFGISFVPSLLVMVTIVTGKQLAHNAPTHGIGLLVMWTGIAIVAAVDGWLLTRVVRR